MRNLVGTILLILLGGCLSPNPSGTSQVPHELHGTSSQDNESCAMDKEAFRCALFVGNYDGDTITVNLPGLPPLFGEGVSVRLIGIDTAEMRGHGPCEKEKAIQARDFVKQTLLRAKRIDLMHPQRDKYFRILADVQVDGKSLSQALIASGLAVAYDGGTKTKVNWCDRR